MKSTASKVSLTGSSSPHQAYSLFGPHTGDPRSVDASMHRHNRDMRGHAISRWMECGTKGDSTRHQNRPDDFRKSGVWTLRAPSAPPPRTLGRAPRLRRGQADPPWGGLQPIAHGAPENGQTGAPSALLARRKSRCPCATTGGLAMRARVAPGVRGIAGRGPRNANGRLPLLSKLPIMDNGLTQ